MNCEKLNLSKYLNEHCYSPIARNSMFESVRNGDIQKALTAIESFLKKRRIYTIPAIDVVNIDKFGMFIVMVYTDDNTGCGLCWRREDTTTLHSLMFTKDFDSCFAALNVGEPIAWDVCVELKGASVVRSLQLIADVLSGRTSMDKASLNKAIRDAQIWESVEVDENITAEDIQLFEGLMTEASADPTIAALERQRNTLYRKIRNAEKKGEDTTGLQAEYDQLKIKLEDARISVRQNVVVNPVNDPALQKMQQRFEEEERALPEERFEDMESYVTNVVLGIDVSALICGAPGVGKTYRIMQTIKKAGLQRGMDYEVIKGKCTPLTLYTMLHDFQQPRQLLIIDDADDIITDDVSINLIKAATDSSDERIVSYGTSVAPMVPEEKLGLFSDFEQDGNGRWRYPKNFVYEGGIIIITNMNAGQIDTAIRSRAMICDLNFTTAEVLDLVRDLSVHICPETLTPESKEKALDYLQELADSGAPMEISIRSFVLVAKLYLSNAPEKAIQRRIREQMKLKFLRGGKRY